jgi:hypothetical protein
MEMQNEIISENRRFKAYTLMVPGVLGYSLTLMAASKLDQAATVDWFGFCLIFIAYAALASIAIGASILVAEGLACKEEFAALLEEQKHCSQLED